VSSDGTVSSGGSSGSAGAPTSVPGSEPGSTGTVAPDATTPSEPAGTLTPAPAIIEPAPSGSIEPVPNTAAPVPFDAAVAVHTSTGSFDTSYVSGLACPLALEAGTAGGVGEVTPVADRAKVSSSTTSSSAPFVIGLLVVTAGALVARYRFTL
jgi:hypothetical protein